jgi:hypothetical protein
MEWFAIPTKIDVLVGPSVHTELVPADVLTPIFLSERITMSHGGMSVRARLRAGIPLIVYFHRSKDLRPFCPL